MILAALVAACFAQDVHDAYARMDTTGLRRLLAVAPTREDSLLARFRLYSLGRDRAVIAQLPDRLPQGTARELALLSALWAWRIPGSAPWNAVTLGRRSQGFLDRALAAAPDDPLVALIDAQSLMFRPGIAGGDVAKGAARARALHARLVAEPPACAVTTAAEAESWLWFGLNKSGDPEAAEVRRRILGSGPLPLFRAFVSP